MLHAVRGCTAWFIYSLYAAVERERDGQRDPELLVMESPVVCDIELSMSKKFRSAQGCE